MSIPAADSPAGADTDAVEAAGQFRIYLGAAAGVGKTYAMLNEGHRRQQRGTNVVVGFVECHGRPLTEQLIGDLEVIPRQVVEYRGSRLAEMDLDAVLRRRPEVALVDELAHTNVPGSGKNEKRWQDVLDILGAGISVITTVNIQHLESIADEVEHMTGVPVRERVPDWVVRKADQIELVDSSPEQLRRRMLHGNIYQQAKVSQALANFFRTDNLTALRELALRFLADETDEELLAHLRRHESSVVWETCERVMVAVTAGPGADALLRRAARMASRLKGDLNVVHVAASDATRPQNRQAIERLRELATDVGARWHELEDDDPARAIAGFAQRHQITQIVIGTSRRSRWQQLTGGGSNVVRVIREAGAFGIDVHVIAGQGVSKVRASGERSVRHPDAPCLPADRGPGAEERAGRALPQGHDRAVADQGQHLGRAQARERVPDWPAGHRRPRHRVGQRGRRWPAGAAAPGSAAFARRRQPVADRRVALQEQPALVAELAPDPVGIDLQVVDLVPVAGAPDVFQDHPAGADLARVAGEVGQEVELPPPVPPPCGLLSRRPRARQSARHSRSGCACTPRRRRDRAVRGRAL